MMTELFDKVEQLTGTYPNGDVLRNAIYAIINGSHHQTVNPIAVGNVEYLARTYEHARGISMGIGESA